MKKERGIGKMKKKKNIVSRIAIIILVLFLLGLIIYNLYMKLSKDNLHDYK